MTRTIIASALLLLTLVGWTKYVWQTGFDQGADVSQCIIGSIVKFGDLSHGADMTDGGCKRAKIGERNLLWQLRRRNGAGIVHDQ